MGAKSKRYRRKKTSDRVVDISGTGFAGPEQHSSAIPAWDPACVENKNRSVMGSLVGALLKPCCGNSSAHPTKTTKVKKIRQNKTVGKPLPVSGDQPSSTTSGPSVDSSESQINSRSGDSGFSSGHLIFSESQLSNASENSLSIIGLGELSERAQAEQTSRSSQYKIDSSTSSSGATTLCVPTSIPGVPDNLLILTPNREKLSPLQPLYLSKAMSNMHRALAKTEEKERIPPIIPIRLRKPQPLSKKQQHLQDKLTAQLMNHSANGERQAMKAKLADKKKVIKEELDKVCRLKKRAKIDERLEKVWKEVDGKPPRREQNAATIQKHNAVIQRLDKEIKLLNEKKECKSMQYQLLHNKHHKHILSETVWRCEAMKIRRRHSSLDKEMEKLQAEVYYRQHKVHELSLISSSSGLGTNPAGQEQAVQEAKSKVNSEPQLSNREEEESIVEEDLFVKYGLAPPVHERKPENTALVALFIGESARSTQQTPNECLRNFQMSCENISSTSLKESVTDSTSTESYDIDSLLESQSSSSLEIYESPPLFRDTSTVSPYTIDEERQHDSATCREFQE